MNKPAFKLAILVTAVALASGAAGYWLAGQRQAVSAEKPAATVANGRKVLYWYDPMVPNQHFDKPGKSPFMDMQLVPKYADAGSEAAGVKIEAGVAQNLAIRLAKVERGSLNEPINVPATVGFDERQVAVVQARSGGFVQKVYARAPGDVIAAGAPLADLLVPEWAGAQQEFLALRASGDAELISAARTRLRLTGMPDALIAQIERSGRPLAVVTVSAPTGGMIQELGVRTGMTVSTGMTLAKINGLDPVWLEAAVPEAQAGLVRVGQPLEARLPAYPGETFKGKVLAVLPQTNADSRTLRVRVALPNRDGRLKPGLVAEMHLAVGAGQSMFLVPSEAVIRTGQRNVVIVDDGGQFQPVEVELGREAGGKTEIRRGLSAGQQVVASGQFLIDSEASLKGVVARMAGKTAASAPASSAAMIMHQASGKVEAINGKEITISHGPVASLGWGAMTMTFRLAKPDLARGIKAGDHVAFDFSQSGGDFVVQQLNKTGGAQ